MEVWGRNFGKIEGGRAPAEDATCFSVFLRVPDMVVKPLLQLYVPGVYFDPRKDKSPDDTYRVIWMNSHFLAEALRSCKTCPKALGLVRLKQKYGLGSMQMMRKWPSSSSNLKPLSLLLEFKEHSNSFLCLMDFSGPNLSAD